MLANPTVVVYGDSLTVQSESAARFLNRNSTAAVVFNAWGGTALCDWVPQAARDRLTLHPQRVILAFTGNTFSCVAAAYKAGGAAGAVASYEHSLRQMRAIFNAESITILIPPAMVNRSGFFPLNGAPALIAMYERVGAELHMSINRDADNWLTPQHRFQQRRPQFPSGPMVDVRLADGVHLTPAGQAWYGAALLEVKPAAPTPAPSRRPTSTPTPTAGAVAPTDSAPPG